MPKQAWTGYGRFCPLARGLDLVGERWTLVIVQELLKSPRRYNELVGRLPGIGTSVLTDRLRKLEAYGLVERRPAGVGEPIVYALTESGLALGEPMRAFRQWGVTHLTRSATPKAVTGSEEQHFDVSYVEGIEQLSDVEFELQVGDVISILSFRDGQLVQRAGPAPADSVRLRVVTNEAFMQRWAAGVVDWDGGKDDGDVVLMGDADAWPQFLAATGYLLSYVLEDGGD